MKFIFARPKTSAAIAFILLIVLATFAQVPEIAQSRLQSMLANAGFREASVDKVYLRTNGFRAIDIKLDASGLDQIKELEADVNWATFFLGGDITGLRVRGVTVSRNASEISSTSRDLIQILMKLPDFRVTLSDVIFDASTVFGDLRFRLEATVDKGNEPGSRAIKALLIADQYQLGFNSEWQGTMDSNGALDMAATILDGRLNMGPLRISRFNGWSALAVNGKEYSAQTQLNAGSAAFMGAPLQNISMIGQMAPDQSVLSIRSGVSGIPDVRFTADLLNAAENQSFAAILHGKNLGGLLDRVDEATNRNRDIPDILLNKRDFALRWDFQPDRRFVGGPLPFSLTLDADESEVLEGNILFYPDTMDVRGSIETDTDMANALQDYFKIPSENIRQNFIRLDGDARKFFTTTKEE